MGQTRHSTTPPEPHYSHYPTWRFVITTSHNPRPPKHTPRYDHPPPPPFTIQYSPPPNFPSYYIMMEPLLKHHMHPSPLTAAHPKPHLHSPYCNPLLPPSNDNSPHPPLKQILNKFLTIIPQLGFTPPYHCIFTPHHYPPLLPKSLSLTFSLDPFTIQMVISPTPLPLGLERSR